MNRLATEAVPRLKEGGSKKRAQRMELEEWNSKNEGVPTGWRLAVGYLRKAGHLFPLSSRTAIPSLAQVLLSGFVEP